MDLIKTLSQFGLCERGNTSLIEADCEGGCVFFAEIEYGQWLKIVMQPENRPAWNITIQYKTLAQIRTDVEENFGNHYFQRNNIGANAEGNMPVDLHYVMSRVRDHLYVYRDNIDYEIKDTVTTIHDFLESNDWSLDIADIETLRQESDEA